MAFRVDVTDLALADAASYVAFIRDVKKEPEAAERWFRGLVDGIYSLEEKPERCAAIPEVRFFSGRVLRDLIYHSHRVVFEVDVKQKRVVVLRIYHGARRRLTPEELVRD